jgi:hypothetical protein
VTDDANRPLAAAAAALVTFGVGALLVVGRDQRKPEITVLLLALTVVVVGRVGGRAGGAAAALMAATTFDFFHTKPYLSLKISDADDIVVTFVILAVGLVAGDLSARASKDRRVLSTRELDADAVSRLLKVARDKPVGDVEIEVRRDLVELLSLRECWFSADPVDMPALGANGSLSSPNPVFRDDGFELPANGVCIGVGARGHDLGWLVCVPEPGVGIGLTRRQTAVAVAHVLGLAMAAEPAKPRRPRRP